MTKHDVLKQYFGYDSFREGQEYLIDSILNGDNILGVMPTGAGKSICFQVPAMLLDGITLVVSPLISLMKDQVNALTQSGISAAYLNSSLSISQYTRALDRARSGEYKIIYVAPERLLTANFLDFAQNAKISMLTVDEAHCISQWGQDFRPSYVKIADFIDSLSSCPIVSAFTATATKQVRDDIVSVLRLNDPKVLVTGFDRKNLYFEVQKPKDKFLALREILEERSEKTGIVYCSTRKVVEEVCDRLNEVGYTTTRYHAGLLDSERQINQDDFIFDRAQLMVATNAFGMGIDKSNVGFVVHYNMPKNLESYYQEAGRAGRDGTPADCFLLYSGQDVRTNNYFIENNRDVEYENEETERIVKERDRQRLKVMTFYCHSNDCLREYMLKYFGERSSNFCSNCSNCNHNFNMIDITIEAQKILSCVARLKGRFGIQMIVDILRGSKGERVLRMGFNELSTYGISELSSNRLRDIINYLVLNNYLCITDDEFPVIKLTNRSGEILHDKKQLEMKLAIEYKKPEKQKKPERYKSKAATADYVDEALFARLKELRYSIAKEQGVPSYIVFADSSLNDMCVRLPSNNEEMLEVSGVGSVKLERYGKQFLDAIAEFTRDNQS